MTCIMRLSNQFAQLSTMRLSFHFVVAFSPAVPLRFLGFLSLLEAF